MSKPREMGLEVRGPLLAGGAPSEVMLSIALSWEEVVSIVRTGQVAAPIVDDIMVKLLELAV